MRWPWTRRRGSSMIKQLFKRADFWLVSFMGFVSISAAYYWLLLKSLSIRAFWANTSMEPGYQRAILILVPITLILFSLNIGVSFFSFRAKQAALPGKSLLGAGIGAFGLACPICGSFLFGLLGISAGLSVLPFAGLELWFFAVILMAYALYQALRRLTHACLDSDSCWRMPAVSKKMNSVLLAGIFIIGIPLSQNIYVKDIGPIMRGQKMYGQCSIYR